MVSVKEVYEVGETPPIGEVPPLMYAQVIRPERFGEPIKAFQVEKVETPVDLGPHEALVLVMAAGINYNNVWAARGVPVNVVQAHQCLPKAPHLAWEEAAAPTLVGATAYRMLRAWPPHTVESGDVVLVWGGSGGLGSMAIQIAREFEALPVAVVSSEDKFGFCLKLGAKGCINRKEFDHWGMLPHWTDNEAFAKWSQGARAFGAKFWEVLGERRSPRIVFEHPGEDTIPTSIFMC